MAKVKFEQVQMRFSKPDTKTSLDGSGMEMQHTPYKPVVPGWIDSGDG